MEVEIKDPQIWLQEEFKERKRHNSRYSLRMLARKLDLPPGRLSELLAGKRQMTTKVAEKIAARLDYTPEKRDALLRIIGKHLTPPGGHDLLIDSNFKQLSSDTFYVVADWYHFAILSLMELDDFDPSPRWISKRLGISIVEVKSALQRLLRLDLIEESDDGRLLKNHSHITTTHDLESVALKRSHKQSLEQSIDAIDEVPVELRDITSMTMSIDAKKLPGAKKMIKNFRRRLCAFLESGPKKNEVYNLNIQLVPVTKNINTRSTK